jgi:lysophospholipase
VLTSDPERFARMHAYIAAEPRLALGGPTFGWLAASFRSIDRLFQDAPAIHTPVLIVSAGNDQVVDNAAQIRLQGGGIQDCRLEMIAGARHEILCERDVIRAGFWRHFDDFLGLKSRP